MSMYQRALLSKSRVSMTRCPSLVTCGLKRRPLRIVHPDDLARRVVWDRGPRRQRLRRRIAVQRIDLNAPRVEGARPSLRLDC